MRKRPRQIDVARLAGVSPTTVSFVLNGRIDSNVRISPETRQRVLDAIETLGYVANPVARSLAGGQNWLLGVFTYEAIFPIQNQDFYYPFLVGIEEEAAALGYDLLLFTSVIGLDGRRSIYRNGANRLQLADGAILLGLEEEKGELLRLTEEDYPFVFVGRRQVEGATIRYVGADYVAATAGIVEHLCAHSHRGIAYLGMAVDNESARDRFLGYGQGLRQAGLTVNPAWVHRTQTEAISPAFVEAHLAQGVTAFVVEHDSIIDHLYSAAAHLGMSIPKDFSVALLGDPLSGSKLSRNVMAFTIPRREMGAQAVRLLAQLLNDSPASAEQIILPCQFVPGETVAPPKG
ncbi:MAG: LacI family DNA-binding transcriptional regulator [Caldilineaceae bacterium]|nr:LacI family DNA-binding transcriptional regulator [Caldilineaceae bacterium]